MRAMARGLRYERLATERANRASARLDRLDARRIAALMNREDARAVRAVGRVAREIASAVDLIVAALGAGGRLIFVGAGTSGRLGVLEAAECPPTFGTPPSRVQAIWPVAARQCSARARAPRTTRARGRARCGPASGAATWSSVSRRAASRRSCRAPSPPRAAPARRRCWCRVIQRALSWADRRAPEALRRRPDGKPERRRT